MTAGLDILGGAFVDGPQYVRRKAETIKIIPKHFS